MPYKHIEQNWSKKVNSYNKICKDESSVKECFTNLKTKVVKDLTIFLKELNKFEKTKPNPGLNKLLNGLNFMTKLYEQKASSNQ